VLELLIMQTKQKGRYDPIHMAVRTPMLDCHDGERLAKIALQGHPMEQRGIVSQLGQT